MKTTKSYFHKGFTFIELLISLAIIAITFLPLMHMFTTGLEQVYYTSELDTARYLRFIEDEVVRLLNEGYWIEDIIDKVKIPEDLAKKPWLQSLYGHPTFIVHGVHRRYAGWYNGNPAELFPAGSTEIAAEVVKLVGVDKLVQEARRLKEEGKVQLSLNIIDFAVRGGRDKTVRKQALLLKSELLEARADAEPSYIARNIFRSGATLTKQEADKL